MGHTTGLMDLIEKRKAGGHEGSDEHRELLIAHQHFANSRASGGNQAHFSGFIGMTTKCLVFVTK